MNNNGGDTDYYRIKPEWKMAQDIIEDRQMNYAQGNIFKVAYCFNVGRHNATDYLRELNKAKWFLEREINRINNQHIDNNKNIPIIKNIEVKNCAEYQSNEY